MQSINEHELSKMRLNFAVYFYREIDRDSVRWVLRTADILIDIYKFHFSVKDQNALRNLDNNFELRLQFHFRLHIS